MRKIIIDTSPLIIHLAGMFNNNLVAKVSLYNFPKDELNCIEKIISQAEDIVITPYVLGESFWLAKTRLGKNKKDVTSVFLNYREILSRFTEISIAKSDILNFKKLEFGLTDASLFLTAKKLKYPILTADKPFIGFCRSEKIDVIDFADPLFNPIGV